MAPELKNVQPLPWRAEPVSADCWRVRDANDFLVFVGVTREEAEFLVRAVNGYHALMDDLHAAALHIWHELESPDAAERGIVRASETFRSGYEHGKRMSADSHHALVEALKSFPEFDEYEFTESRYIHAVMRWHAVALSALKLAEATSHV